MARILLIETATEVCSAAIAVDGAVIALEEAPNSQSHAALLTLQVEACAKKSGIALSSLDAVALSRGPGSYTALRVGASVAKGICYALDKPLMAVDTLQALADAMRRETPHQDALFIPAIDARRQEIWTAVYDAKLQLLAPAQPLIIENNSFEDFMTPFSGDANYNWFVLGGNGAFKIESGRIGKNTVVQSEIICSARHLAALAEASLQNADFQDVAYFEPFYMKLPNITTPNNRSF